MRNGPSWSPTVRRRLQISLEQQEVYEQGSNPGLMGLRWSFVWSLGGFVCVKTKGNCIKAQEKRLSPTIITAWLVLT